MILRGEVKLLLDAVPLAPDRAWDEEKRRFLSMYMVCSFDQATVASVQSDGRLTTYCNDADHLALGKHRHEAKSDAVLTAPAAPANTREER